MTFTLQGYRTLLETGLNNGYTFLPFGESADRCCLLRHDIDASLTRALALAEIEKDLGISATYFVMLRSPVYNLFSRHNHRAVEKILSLGHFLGLHYDEGFDSISRIDLEKETLEKMFRTQVGVVSFHQPSQGVLSNQFKVKGMLNTYDKEDMQGFHYVSDSNMDWKRETPLQIFQNKLYARLHLLIHPMWWAQEREGTCEQIWSHVIQENFAESEKQLLLTERAYGAEREALWTKSL